MRAVSMSIVNLIIPSLASPLIATRLRMPPPRRPFATAAASNSRFGWDDVMRVANDASYDESGPFDLTGYFDRVRTCNRGSDKQSEFVPFFVENEMVGYVHRGFLDHLRKFEDVFVIVPAKDGCHESIQVRLHSSLKTPQERTLAVADVVKSLGELIPGIRNELYPVTSSFGMPIYFSLERAAAPYFGIKAYGVHMNGYVESDGQKFLWIGKRSDLKPTFPGMLDHLVAGGLPHGISCQENLIKECVEEAGIPRSISINATAGGAISYMDINGYSFKRDVLFCYDLKLPAEFIPRNEDGEVDSFRLLPVSKVAKIIRQTDFYKPNCAVVIIDFLIRHGFIDPDNFGYLKLLQSLRSGECS